MSRHEHILDTVDSAKYLGVTINTRLSWTPHIDNITASSYRTLGLLRRNLKNAPTETKTLAYNTLVRPNLEYCASVWDPHTTKDVNKIEMVQRRAARFVTNRYHNTSSVNSMLSSLNWPTLQQRRSNIRMCMVFKIIHQLVAIPQENYFTPKCRLTSNQHPHTFLQYQTTRDYFKYSFFPRSIPQWNSLPMNIVTAPSLVSFQHRLVAHQTTPI